MGDSPTLRQLFVGKAVAAKNRVISGLARGANHLPSSGKPAERVGAIGRCNRSVVVRIG